MTEYAVKPGGTPKWTLDTAANDSNKIFTVPAGKAWMVLMVYVDYQSTATVGTRLISMRVLNPTPANVFVVEASPTTASKLSTHTFQAGGSKTSAAAGGQLMMDGTTLSTDTSAFVPFPVMYLSAGCAVQVLDAAAIDAAADDMKVSMHYIEYDA